MQVARRAAAAVLAASALVSSALAQTAVSTSFEHQAHLAAVRAERSADFLAAWGAASADARDAARAVLSARATGVAPLGARPDLDALAAATRALAGEDPADDLAAFADSLDLQVRPGAFAATEPDGAVGPPKERDGNARGEPLTVRVYRLRHLPRSSDAELSLVWLGPSGERIHARREPFGATAFHGRGFDMYVRAPVSEPGPWRLQPVVRRDGREVAGAAVPVACVARLEQRVAALGEREVSRSGRAALDDLFARGLRRPEAPSAAELLAILEAGVWADPVDGERAEDAPPGVARGARLIGRAAFGPDRRGGKGALVFLWSGDDGEELPFFGAVGDAWRALAEQRGLGLFSLAAGAGDVGGLRAGLARAATESGGAPILVARATAATQALLMLAMTRDEPLELGGLVFVQPTPAPPPGLPDAPVLAVLAASPSTASDSTSRSVAIRRLPPAPLFGERELPGLVEDWLAAGGSSTK